MKIATNCGLYSLLLSLVFSCTPNLTEQVFSIEEEGTVIDLSSIKTIDQFDSLYCQIHISGGELPLIIPFNFTTSNIDQTSHAGISAFGNPFNCGADCCSGAISLLISDEKIYLDYDEEYVTLDQIDSLVRLNLFNYGNEVELSIYPEDAIFIIKAYPETELIEFQPVLKHISNSYLEIITEQTNIIGLKNAMDSFPLNLILSTYRELPPLPDWVKDLEIEVATELIDDTLVIEGLE